MQPRSGARMQPRACPELIEGAQALGGFSDRQLPAEPVLFPLNFLSTAIGCTPPPGGTSTQASVND